MNILEMKSKKIYLNGIEIPYVEDVDIKKHADDYADVTLKIIAKVKGLDVD